jgi:NAD(P)-dependent dehydrogenase (short-subunit alcohol dehydrogenase family)
VSESVFTGQVVVVTGGGTGIGRAAARAFVEQGPPG